MPPIQGPSRIKKTSRAPQPLSNSISRRYRGERCNSNARTKYAGAKSGTNQRIVQQLPDELLDVEAYRSQVPTQQPTDHNTSGKTFRYLPTRTNRAGIKRNKGTLWPMKPRLPTSMLAA